MPRKKLQGIVVSDKMQKTVVVQVERIREHPKYKKRFKVHKKYKAHDEKEECRVGDKVLIEETRPLSKEKRWKVVKILERKLVEAGESEAEDKKENEIENESQSLEKEN